MTPDAGYFIGQRYLAKFAHYPSGTVLICLPTGLVLLALFYLLRRDITYILPAPHRTHLTPIAGRKLVWNTQFLLAAALSIVIGAWTHIVWDQFTHDGNYLNRHVAILRITLFHIGWYKMSISHLLQYISTIGGGGFLLWFYWKWLCAQPPKDSAESDTWRYTLLFSSAVVACAIGIAVGIHLGDPVHDSETFRELVYKMGVTTVSAFTFLIAVSAILCYRPKLAKADL